MNKNPFQRSCRLLWLPVAVIVLESAPAAQAHIVKGEAGGFWSGLHHPLSGLDHITAMVAVGLWGAQLGGRAMWLLPVVFPMVMACGGFCGLIGLPLPGQEIGIALSALLLGLMVVARVTPKSLIWPAILVGAFGFYHGHAHGTELPPGQSGLFYSIGFVIATGMLHLCGITHRAAQSLEDGRGDDSHRGRGHHGMRRVFPVAGGRTCARRRGPGKAAAGRAGKSLAQCLNALRFSRPFARRSLCVRPTPGRTW